MRGGCGRNLIVSSSYLLVRAVSSRIGLQSVSIFSTSYFVSPRFFTGALSIACNAIPNRCLSKSSDTLVPLFLLIRFINFYNKRRGHKEIEDDRFFEGIDVLWVLRVLQSRKYIMVYRIFCSHCKFSFDYENELSRSVLILRRYLDIWVITLLLVVLELKVDFSYLLVVRVINNGKF